MNEDVFRPKKGWFAEYESLPILNSRWSCAFGLTSEKVQHFMDGYENPVTHAGRKTEFFITFFGKQFAVGYNSVEPVKPSPN